MPFLQAPKLRWSEPDGSVKDDHAIVLLGNRIRAAESSFDLVPGGNVIARAVHGVAVRVRADESRLMSMIDGIDWKGLVKPLAE